VEHWVTNLLLAKGKKHVLEITAALFDRTGKRVWEMKKKDSCCRSLEFGSADFNEADYPVDKETFMKLFQAVVTQFAKR
jgi:hypothetical protein